MSVKTIAVISMIIVIAGVLVGFGARAVGATSPATIPMDKSDMYQLQAVVAKANLANQQIQNLYIQFINQNPEARQLKANMDALVTEQNTLVDRLYADAKLSKAEYYIDPDKGQFVKVQKPSPPVTK